MPYVTLTTDNVERIKVPDAERRVLEILSHNPGMHAPAIARASNDEISIDSIYNLLKRLFKRGLVEKQEALVEVGDLKIKRVLYHVKANVHLPEQDAQKS